MAQGFLQWLDAEFSPDESGKTPALQQLMSSFQNIQSKQSSADTKTENLNYNLYSNFKRQLKC